MPILEKSSVFLFANEEDFAKCLAQAYNNAMLASATSVLGHKFVSGNASMLEKM